MECAATDSTSPSANTRAKIRSADDVTNQQDATELNSSKGTQRKAQGTTGHRQTPARERLLRSKISASASNLYKTSEQLELEKISALRAEAAKARRLAQVIKFTGKAISAHFA